MYECAKYFLNGYGYKCVLDKQVSKEMMKVIEYNQNPIVFMNMHET